MPTFVSTVQFSDQGRREIRATCNRAEKFKVAAAKMGVELTSIFWTLGPFDGVLIFDAPDEETATAAMLYLGSYGNVQTQTARAYRAEEMEQLLTRLPG
jgi:uncharacterized protein with GYD domain